ncbi:MAG: DUF1849 family protein [Rhodospirillaceae bacterium]|nr:DUF1849 family protein [Rhodospirillaceae bacterium]
MRAGFTPIGLLGATLICQAMLLVLPASAGAVELKAHRAAYDIRMADQSGDSTVVGISGRVLYALEKVCGGWILQQEHAMAFELENGNVVPEYISYSSWESEDGTRFRFSSNSSDNSEGNILGDAIMGDASGEAIFKRPEETVFDLPKGTLFPTAHTRQLLEHALAGNIQHNATTFEGAELEGAKRIVAFISPLKAKHRKKLGALVEGPGWTFRLAYFDLANPSPEPMYEVEADLLSNGIATRWLLDFGDYSAEMNLVKIEALRPSAC